MAILHPPGVSYAVLFAELFRARTISRDRLHKSYLVVSPSCFPLASCGWLNFHFPTPPNPNLYILTYPTAIRNIFANQDCLRPASGRCRDMADPFLAAHWDFLVMCETSPPAYILSDMFGFRDSETDPRACLLSAPTLNIK